MKRTISVEVAAPFVYFTADISPEGLQAVYELGKKLK